MCPLWSRAAQSARANLAAYYRQAGRTADAMTIEEKVVADFERLFGYQHPDTPADVAALRSHGDVRVGMTSRGVVLG